MFKSLICISAASLSLYASAAQAGDYCREYTQDIRVGGRIQEGYSTACLQPDGAWQTASANQPNYNNNYSNNYYYPSDNYYYKQNTVTYSYRPPSYVASAPHIIVPRPVVIAPPSYYVYGGGDYWHDRHRHDRHGPKGWSRGRGRGDRDGHDGGLRRRVYVD